MLETSRFTCFSVFFLTCFLYAMPKMRARVGESRFKEKFWEAGWTFDERRIAVVSTQTVLRDHHVTELATLDENTSPRSFPCRYRRLSRHHPFACLKGVTVIPSSCGRGAARPTRIARDG